MKRSIATLVIVLAALPSSWAEDSDDTLRFILSKGEVCVAGTIVDEPSGPWSDALLSNYAVQVDVSEILKGAVQKKSVTITVVRLEGSEKDKLPFLRKGTMCIFVLKRVPRGDAEAFTTGDIWLGVLPYSHTMASRLKAIATVKRPEK